MTARVLVLRLERVRQDLDGADVGPLQFEQRHHERFRNIASPVGAEASRRCGCGLKQRAHGLCSFS